MGMQSSHLIRKKPGRDKDTRLDFLKEEIRVAKLLDHPILGADSFELKFLTDFFVGMMGWGLGIFGT